MDEAPADTRSSLRRLMELGVQHDTPGRQRKSIIPLNVVCLAVFCLGIAWTIAGAVVGSWTLVLVALSYHLGSTALTLYLNARGRYSAAALYFFAASIATLVSQVLLWGTDIGIEAFLLGCAVAPFLVFPSPVLRYAYIYSGVSVMAWTAIEFMRPIQGIEASPGDFFFGGNAPMIGVLLILIGGYFRSNSEEAEDQLETAMERSDELLLNILPMPIADRLKANPQQVIADRFEAVTVLFCDIVGFTNLSARTDPQDLVRLLDEIFTSFDALSDRHGLEKIKTIGDSYMAAAGLPAPRDDHAHSVAAMALDMVEAVAAFSERTGAGLRVRVGIASGPVVAGVIGKRKFVYDLWGDVVNTAARMESHGEPGRVQVTDACRALLSGAFILEERGSVDVKGKGPMQTHWLIGRA